MCYSYCADKTRVAGPDYFRYTRATSRRASRRLVTLLDDDKAYHRLVPLRIHLQLRCLSLDTEIPLAKALVKPARSSNETVEPVR